MVEQAKVLEDDADAAAERRHVGAFQTGGVLAENGNETARRLEVEEQQADQRRLAGAGRAGQELEGMGGDREGQIAQHLPPRSIAEADIFKPDHASFPPQSPAGLRPLASAPLSVFRGFVPKAPLRAAPLGAGSRACGFLFILSASVAGGPPALGFLSAFRLSGLRPESPAPRGAAWRRKPRMRLLVYSFRLSRRRALRPLASAPLSVFRSFVPKAPLRAAPLGAGSRACGFLFILST